MTAPDRLAEMTTLDAADAVARGTIVLIPAGALEQHGPGMALGTDLVRAEAVVAQVASNLAGRVVVGPSIPVGVSPHHMAFPGTVTLTTGTFAAVVREYVTSLYRHGWTRFLVVTGHGGNNATLTTVAQDLLVSHPGIQLAWSPLTSLAGDAVAAMGPSAVPRALRRGGDRADAAHRTPPGAHRPSRAGHHYPGPARRRLPDGAPPRAARTDPARTTGSAPTACSATPAARPPRTAPRS